MLLFFKNILWSPVTIILILLLGIILTLRTRARALRHPIKKIKNTILTKENTRSSFEATFTALGGTIGVGNTIGVAGAIKDGGPGAVFWMLIASVFGMVIKEAEIYLAVKYKRIGSNFSGPMYYIEDRIGSRFVAKLWSFSCILTAFGMGNMSQTMASANSLSKTFKVDKISISFVLSFIIFLTLCKGISFIKKHISSLTATVAVAFIFILIYIILSNKNNLPSTFSGIFKNAFAFDKITGGIKWAVFAKAVQTGFTRGIFTNEAGLGSACIIHSTSSEACPEKQSAWGVIEVFIDTVLICTLTALAILTCTKNVSNLPTADVTFSVFSISLGRFGEAFYSVSTILFAIASILAWYCYAECALKYLKATKKQLMVFKIIFSLSSLLGGIIESETIIVFSDIFNGIMLLINICAMFLLSREAKSD